jgi:hypothetical protein
MKIYVPWQTGDCEVERVWVDLEYLDGQHFDFFYNYNKSNPNIKNIEKVDGKIKFKLLTSKYYVEVDTVEEVLNVLSYFNMYDPETSSLKFEED